MQVIKTATEIPQDAGSDVVNDFDDAVAEQIETEYRAEYLAKVEKNVAIFRSQEGIKFIDCNDGHVINELLLTDDLIMNKYCFNGKIMINLFFF